jgi:L-lactate dehydrogenase
MSSKCTPPNFQTKFKVSVVGAGNVGASAAYAMLLDGTPTDLALVDLDGGKAEGIVLDLEHSMSFLSHTEVTGGDDLELCRDSQLIVVTAGARQKEGETRLDLIEKNRKIFAKMIPKLAEVAPNSILLIVSNPVDVLTYEAWKLSGFPKNRVIGSGTMLDTARLKFHISERLCLNPASIEAFVLGEHGDSSFPVFSSANVAGKALLDFEGFTEKVAADCYEETKTAAYRIINDVGYTCYSIGVVISEIMQAIFEHARIVTPLSVVLEDYYGHSDVALSVPCILDSSGVSETLKVPLDEKELEMLAKSAKVLKGFQQ